MQSAADDRDPTERPPVPSEPPRLVSSEELLSGRTELHILHAGNVYRLRVTRQNKLILTK